MKIENQDTKGEWDRVVLRLTLSEARELRGALDHLIAANDRARHEHVPNRDFSKEITVVITD